jgi:hypothetical protein
MSSPRSMFNLLYPCSIIELPAHHLGSVSKAQVERGTGIKPVSEYI